MDTHLERQTGYISNSVPDTKVVIHLVTIILGKKVSELSDEYGGSLLWS